MLSRTQLKSAWSLTHPNNHEVNYLAIACIILHTIATVRGVKKKRRKKKTHLAGGRGLLAAFLVVQGRSTCGWWGQQLLRRNNLLFGLGFIHFNPQ